MEFEFTVDADGHATAAKPLQDPTSKWLVPEVQKSLSHWQFAPAHVQGGASVSHVQIPVLFVSEPPLVPTAPDAGPQMIYREAPTYPQAARLQGVPGHVAIAALVDVEGRIRDAEVIESSDRIFERPAIAAMLRWRFRPARYNGFPVRSKIVQEFTFTMSDSDQPGLLWVRKEPEKLKHLPPSLQWDTAP